MKQKKISSDLKGYKLKFSQKIYRFFKAFIDFITALVAIIITSPIFLITAIAIKIESKGPVFFCQERIGYKGKIFKCIKFRSMTEDANHYLAGYEYGEAKSYITKVGAFIRKTSIDELPQLYNILTFKMSLIGYRPAQENEVELNVPRSEYNMYQVRPGITGWAQINGRDVLAAQPEKKAQFDNYYLQKFSVWLDIKIFFLTIFKVFSKEGVAEGIIDTNCKKEIEEEKAVTVDSSVADSIKKVSGEEKEQAV